MRQRIDTEWPGPSGHTVHMPTSNVDGVAESSAAEGNWSNHHPVASAPLDS